MKRRSFLSLVGASAVSATMAQAASRRQGWDSTRHVLVLLELRGGNDGLNTVIPYRNPLYYEARPTLAIRDSIPLTDTLALHPALAPLLPLWERKRIGFALGVGWDKPNRSHFKASDQWAAGNQKGDGMGWLAKAYREQRLNGPMVALGPSGCAAMEGGEGEGTVLEISPTQFRQPPSGDTDQQLYRGESPILRRMIEEERTSQEALNALRSKVSPLPNDVRLPKSRLGEQVGLAIQLINSGACPSLLQIAQTGYDTHSNQATRQSRCLNELADALATLDAALLKTVRRPKVTILAVSEFGRRLTENGSKGTDHGSASIAFIAGDELNTQLMGSYPSLKDLDERGDLIPSTSPIQLYEAVIHQIRF